MVEGGDWPAFPAVFFDGEKEMNIGNVEIYPELEYKPFQVMLSQKIGISPNQISIYLVDRKRNRKSPFAEDRRRIPITGKTNFASICRQTECCFLVILKRSRKSRNRRERMMNGADFLSENEFSPNPVHPAPDNLVLLRMDQPLPFYDHITQSGLDDLNVRLQSLRIQRENCLTAKTKGNVNSPNFSSEHGWDPNFFADSVPAIDDINHVDSTSLTMAKVETDKAFCEECCNAENGGTTSFHPCINDAVITHFTARLGPIDRPHRSLH